MPSYEMVPMKSATESDLTLPSDRDLREQGRHEWSSFSKFPTISITHGSRLPTSVSAMNHVLLLRAPSKDGEEDPYDAAFRALGPSWAATSIQVLDTKFTNLQELQWIIQTGPGFHGYKGVILTSSRSADAWKEAVGKLGESAGDAMFKANWTSTPFYVVGESTANAVRDHPQSHSSSFYPSEFLGSDTGTGEQLAQFITLRNTTSKKRKTKFLFLVGDKNRDTMPKALEAAGYELDSLQVYETCESQEFAASLASLVSANPMTKTWWITCYAPSSTDFALPHLRGHFTLTSSAEEPASPATSVARIAAIGPTTAKHLQDKLQLKVDAIAAKPKPEDLVEAITSSYS